LVGSLDLGDVDGLQVLGAALLPDGEQGTGGVWFCIIAVELAAAAALYLKETLNLFLSKKVSILHWFLYLCTVEVFPVSLLWLLAVR